jgi:hypothetical protein
VRLPCRLGRGRRREAQNNIKKQKTHFHKTILVHFGQKQTAVLPGL